MKLRRCCKVMVSTKTLSSLGDAAGFNAGVPVSFQLPPPRVCHLFKLTTKVLNLAASSSPQISLLAIGDYHRRHGNSTVGVVVDS